MRFEAAEIGEVADVACVEGQVACDEFVETGGDGRQVDVVPDAGVFGAGIVVVGGAGVGCGEGVGCDGGVGGEDGVDGAELGGVGTDVAAAEESGISVNMG